MTLLLAALLTALAYLLGAIPFALLLGKIRGVDIRKAGSGNIGATNLSRILGRRWGIAAFLLDFGKGLLPVLAARLLAPVGSPVRGEHAAMACGLAAVLGHVFPVYLGFRGGKGVATTFGVVTALSWEAALVAGAIWLVLFLATRTVSIASLGSAAAFPVATLVAYRRAPADVLIPMVAVAAGVAVLIAVRHRSNIRRLLQGQENRF